MKHNSSAEFGPPLSTLLAAETVVGRTGKRFKTGHSTLHNLRVMAELMEEFQPARTLEIGLLFGASALLLAGAHKAMGRPGLRQHVALDPFQDKAWDDAGVLAIEHAGLSDWFELRRDYSSIELPRMLAADEQFGMIYVDGSHIFEDVFIDAYYGARLLGQGGVMLFDDSADPHVAKVIRFLRKNCGDSLEELDLAAYYPKGKARLRYTAGRLAGRNQLTAFRRSGKIERAWDAPFTNF